MANGNHRLEISLEGNASIMGALCGCGPAVLPSATEGRGVPLHNETEGFYEAHIAQDQALIRERSRGKDWSRNLIIRDLETIQELLEQARKLDCSTPVQLGGERKTLAVRLQEAFEAFCEMLTELETGQKRVADRGLESLDRLRGNLARLGQKMAPLDSAAGRIAVLKAVTERWDQLTVAYVKLRNSSQAALSAKSQADSLRVQGEELQQSLAHQETRHSDLTRELQALRQLALQRSRQLHTLSLTCSSNSLRYREVQERVALLEQEVKTERESLLEAKEQIRSSREEGSRLEKELEEIRAVFSPEDMQQHIQKLQTSLASLQNKADMLNAEVAAKKQQQEAEAEHIQQLETRISANRQVSSASDVSQKMQSMQATLHDLLSTLGNASDSDDCDQVDLDTALE